MYTYICAHISYIFGKYKIIYFLTKLSNILSVTDIFSHNTKTKNNICWGLFYFFINETNVKDWIAQSYFINKIQ